MGVCARKEERLRKGDRVRKEAKDGSSSVQGHETFSRAAGMQAISRSTDYVSQSWETTGAGIEAGVRYDQPYCPAAATCEVRNIARPAPQGILSSAFRWPALLSAITFAFLLCPCHS